MHPYVRLALNILAIPVGWLGGSIVNMSLVNVGHSIFPIEGIDPKDFDALVEVMPHTYSRILCLSLFGACLRYASRRYYCRLDGSFPQNEIRFGHWRSIPTRRNRDKHHATWTHLVYSRGYRLRIYSYGLDRRTYWQHIDKTKNHHGRYTGRLIPNQGHF